MIAQSFENYITPKKDNMQFYENQLFHIFNQGNNRQQIFFKDGDYHLFLWKMRAYLGPFGVFVAYALMPNHYHFQFYVQRVYIKRKELWEHADKVEWQRRVFKYKDRAQAVKRGHQRQADPESLVPIYEAIGILQFSYTNTINREHGWSGSLFRQNFKAVDGWTGEFNTVDDDNSVCHRFGLGNDYGLTCFNYIHKNATEAGLVSDNVDWPFSSARDYAGLRNGTVCDVTFGKKLLQLP